MRKRIHRIISLVLTFCLMLSATTAFADNGNYSAIQTYVESLILDGEQYTVEKKETDILTETKMYDSTGDLVGHMKYDKINHALIDLFNNKEINFEIRLNEKVNNIGPQAIKDSEGYYYQGDYTVDIGLVYSAATLALLLITKGYSASQATEAARFVSFGVGFVYLKGSLWWKTDGTYDYNKRIESIYEKLTANDYKIYGPTTFKQKKAVDL